MDKCIDLYSRLLIATITFVVPVIINLLSTFASGEKRRKELSQANEDVLSKQTAQEIQANPNKIRETVAQTHAQFVMNEKKTKAELELLNPIIQFWRIVTPLVLCFVMLMISYLIRNNYLGLYNKTFLISILLMSLTFYFIGLFYIVRILYTISKTKKIVDT